MTIKTTKHLNVLTPTETLEYRDLEVNLYWDARRKRYWASAMPCMYVDSAKECQPLAGKFQDVLKVDGRRSAKLDQQAITIFDANQSEYIALFK